jgi:hypothetical protein
MLQKGKKSKDENHFRALERQWGKDYLEYKKKTSIFFSEYDKFLGNKKGTILYYGYIMIDSMKKHESYVKEILLKKLD